MNKSNIQPITKYFKEFHNSFLPMYHYSENNDIKMYLRKKKGITLYFYIMLVSVQYFGKLQMFIFDLSRQ